ncbi:MAG: hypothetical protein IJN29_02595 [Akkermansia sp.]|nr:hypothetical protein [Akkermansia sp.]
MNIPAHTILLLPAVCCMATAQQPSTIEQFCAEAATFADTLTKALETLQKIENKEQADAAVPAILTVHEGQARMRKVATGHELPQLWRKADVRLALRSIPAPQFTAAVRATQANGCYGSVKLYLALHNRLNEFTEEQINAPISEADAATLREVEACFTGVADIMANSWYIDKYYANFLQHLKAATPGVPALQQTPAAAMRYAQLVEKHRPMAEEFRKQRFRNRGEVEEHLVLQDNNFYSALYTKESRLRYFENGKFNDNPQFFVMHAEKQLHDRVWAQYEAAILAAAAKRGLTGGKGRDVRTAFELPANLKINEVEEYVNSFAQEVFGERYTYSDAKPRISRNSGRYVVQALGIAGRPGDKNVNNDSIQVIPIYFNLPQNTKPAKNTSVQIYSKHINIPQEQN